MTKALQPLPGVAEIKVDFPNRIAHCKVEKTFDVENAIATLDKAGYSDSTVVQN